MGKAVGCYLAGAQDTALHPPQAASDGNGNGRQHPVHWPDAGRFQVVKQFVGQQQVMCILPTVGFWKGAPSVLREAGYSGPMQRDLPSSGVVLGIDGYSCHHVGPLAFPNTRSEFRHERCQLSSRMSRRLFLSNRQRRRDIEIALGGRQQGKEAILPQLLPRYRLDLEGFLYHGGVYWGQSANPSGQRS